MHLVVSRTQRRLQSDHDPDVEHDPRRDIPVHILRELATAATCRHGRSLIKLFSKYFLLNNFVDCK